MNFLPFDFIGKTFGEERCVPEYGDPTNFESGLLVDGGICYMQFLKKLFIPCYARTENVRKTLCSSQGLSDPAQRCRDRRTRKRKCKKRKDCVSQKPPEPKPMCPRSPLSDIPRCIPKKPEPPPPEPTPPPQEAKKSKEECNGQIKCPHCSKATTIIICDSCNKCHKIECGSK